MTIKFEPPLFWELDEIRKQFDAIKSSDEQLLFILQVEDAIEGIWTDILIAEHDPPDGRDMIYYNNIPEIRAFCSRKRALIEQTLTVTYRGVSSPMEDAHSPEALLRIKGNRLDWTGSLDDLNFLFESLADTGLIPKEQCGGTAPLQHFWLAEETNEAQYLMYAGLSPQSTPIQWRGEIIRLAELLWELNGKFIYFDSRNTRPVLDHFRSGKSATLTPLKHSTFKVYFSNFRTDDDLKIRVRNSTISEIADALARRMLNELHR